MNIDKEKLLNKAHEQYFELILGDFPLEQMDEIFAEDISGWGTTVDEKILEINRLRKMLVDQKVQGKGIEMKYVIEKVNQRISPENDMAIFTDEVRINMNIESDINTINLRLSTVYEFYETNWKIVHFHGSTAVESKDDTWHLNEWKRKNEELQKLVKEKTADLEKTLENLKATQAQLIHSEKMASLGELTAGIAHEIQNPLNFVNNFSEVSEELVTELKEELKKGDVKEAKIISDDVVENLKKINYHGQRAAFIVKGMLEHSRTSTGEKKQTNINVLAEEFLKLSYHGLRAKDKTFNAGIKLEFDKNLPLINVVAQDFGRVLLNLINNAFYAVAEKQIQHPENYEPEVMVSTKLIGNNIEISVSDNGNGIPAEVKEKIFQPFFTTKPAGEGTGLGLSLSYDIITKGHNGNLKVETIEQQGTKFIINIPVNN